MTIQELKSKYTEKELSWFPGDMELRYQLFSPFFHNLYENKLVFNGRMMGIVKIETMEITPARLRLSFIPYLCIKQNNRNDELFFSRPKWTVTGSWNWMLLGNNSISVPYASWSIWFEPAFVKMIEELTLKQNFDEVSDLLWK